MRLVKPAALAMLFPNLDKRLGNSFY